MAPRVMAAAQGRPWLSWGELSAMPGSVVFDVAGAMVFPGSPVVRADARAGAGVVAELVSATVVRVAWAEGEEPRVAQAVALRVTGPFVRPEMVPAPRSGGVVVPSGAAASPPVDHTAVVGNHGRSRI